MMLMNHEEALKEQNARYALHCPLVLSEESFFCDLVEYDIRYLSTHEPDTIKEFIIRLQEARKQYKEDIEKKQLITEYIYVTSQLYEDTIGNNEI